MHSRLSVFALPTLALALATPLWPESAQDAPLDAPPTVARFIRATVSMDGKILLRGSTSDMGRVDADGVWRYLQHIEFEPQDGFAAHVARSTDKDAVVLETKDRSRTVELLVAYGGLAKTRELRIERVPGDGAERWRVARAEIDQEAPYRWITRAWAAQLEKQRLPRKR